MTLTTLRLLDRLLSSVNISVADPEFERVSQEFILAKKELSDAIALAEQEN